MDGFDGDMRDMLGCASHVEVCGEAAVFWISPPDPRRTGNRNGKRSAS